MRKYLLISPLLLLTACSAKTEINPDFIRGARSSMRASSEFAGGYGGASAGTSAAAAGIGLGARFARQTESPEIPGTEGEAEKPPEDAALIDKLVKLLDTDVRNLLNGSRDRATALETYVSSLDMNIRKAESRLRTLGDKTDDLNDDVKRLERGVRELRKELDNAIVKNYGRGTGALTRQLTARQTALSTAQTGLVVAKRLAEVYADLLKPLAERLEAIRQNKNAIVKGVKVVDLPGVEELGILEVGRGRKRR